MNKIILTDIDDTVLKFAEGFEAWAIKKKHLRLKEGMTVRGQGSIMGPFGLSREETDELVIEFSEENFYCLQPEPDALQVIPQLYAMGYQFVGISSCINTYSAVADRRDNLTRVFGIPWLDVHCVGLLQSKKAILERYEPAIWVEDNAHHALVGARLGHKTYLLDRPYNDGVLPIEENLKKAISWEDVLIDVMFATEEEPPRKSIDQQLLDAERQSSAERARRVRQIERAYEAQGELPPKRKYGMLKVFCGPMYAGKSTNLINSTVWYNDKSILVVKPAFDNRFSETEIVTHDGRSIAARSTDDFNQIRLHAQDVDAVFIDEVQFFHEFNPVDHIVYTVRDLLNQGKDVFVAGLDMDWQGRAFEATANLCAMADHVYKLRARCAVCDDMATKTYKKSESGFQIELGAEDLYEARCNEHWKS